MATFLCDSCGHSQDAPEQYIGKQAKCPKCNQRGSIASDAHSIVALSDAITRAEEIDHQPTIRRCDGGSIQTPLGYGIILNQHSSMRREWITIIDPSFPAQFVGEFGVRTIYEKEGEYSTGQYYFHAKYAIRSTEPIVAIEVRFLTFNIWGTHERTLSALEIQDMDANKTYSFDGKWSLFSENEACEHYASVSFVSQVRTVSGKVLQADRRTVLAEAKRMSDRFSESDLEPTKR